MDAAHGFEREAIWSNSGVNKIDDDGLAYLINAGHELHTVAAAMRDDQKAVVLDFVNPARAGRRLLCWPRKARLISGKGLLGANAAPQLTRY
jgi:hypothetical protein